MASRQWKVGKLYGKLLYVDSRKEQDCLVCFQYVLVDRLQISEHHVTTVIGIEADVML